MKRGVDIWLVGWRSARPLPFMQARASTALFVQSGDATAGRARTSGDATAGRARTSGDVTAGRARTSGDVTAGFGVEDKSRF